jgi:murein DD-endopeptidase MepM/ murein hydrolase activator NlpD
LSTGLVYRLRQVLARTRLSENRAPKRAVWLLGFALLATSVTIASIPRNDPGAPVPPPGLVAQPPPQTVSLGDEELPGERHDAPSAAEHTAATSPERPVSHKDYWFEAKVRRGDNLVRILQREGFEAADLMKTLQEQRDAKPLYQLLPGQTLRLRTDGHGRLQELHYNLEQGETLRVVRTTGGFGVSRDTRNFETRVAHVRGTIESSLFEDGQEAGLSDALIMKLVEIFGWDIDFARDVQHGDGFTVIHEEKYWYGQKVADGAILAAEFIHRGRPYTAIGHRNASGFTSYYTPEGMSMRRPFLRTPVEFSRITSRFTNARYHPILKTWRAHTGVDYGAPPGTPVRATASGRVISLEWNGGYGKTIVIKHNSAYHTLYAHLSRYHPGIRVGSFVEQGQIIGYVGKTGLATGPHLHYEFQVNGRHRDPLRFRFPGSTPIPHEHRQDFLHQAGILKAKLDQIGGRTLVASGRQP